MADVLIVNDKSENKRITRVPERQLRALGAYGWRKATDDEIQRAAAEEAGVPSGPVDEVIDWIGDDPARAQAALDAEAQRDKPRSTVTDRAEAVIAAATSDSTDQSQEA